MKNCGVSRLDYFQAAGSCYGLYVAHREELSKKVLFSKRRVLSPREEQKTNLSNEREEERREYVERDPAASVAPVSRDYIVRRDEPATVERVPVASVPANERREAVVKSRSTNVGAVVAIVVGIIVLLSGIYLVFTQIRYLPAPYSWIAILIVGLILIGVGASLVRSRTSV